MQKEDLERLTNGLVSGGGPERVTVTDADGNEYDYNLIGAINAIVNNVQDIEEYGSLTWDDLDSETQTEIEMGQKALQELMGEIGTLFGDVTGNDGSITLGNGSTINLPAAATDATKSTNVPENGGN